MCVIIVSDKQRPLPSRRTLRKCWEANPDGAGFAWADGSTVHIRKGYMELKSFLAAWAKLKHDIRDRAVIVHFRRATSGKTGPGMCHPFPASSDEEELLATSVDSADFAIAHNGVVGNGEKFLSDTAVYIRDKLAPLGKLLRNAAVLNLVSDTLSWDRLAILHKSGHVSLLGAWKNIGGLLYSNDLWCWRPSGVGFAGSNELKWGKADTVADIIERRMDDASDDFPYEWAQELEGKGDSGLGTTPSSQDEDYETFRRVDIPDICPSCGAEVTPLCAVCGEQIVEYCPD